MSSKTTRTFERPYRTLVARALNAMGRLFRGVGLRRPLRVDRILQAASKKTGLSDWGDESFREPLERLLGSLEEEGRLTPLGRLFLHYTFVHHAKRRLRLQHWIGKAPAILDEQVRRPLFVVGLPRTGTTLLHNLLCQDRRGRPLLLWEALEPVPQPSMLTFQHEPRIERARQFVSLITRHGAPQLPLIHPMEAEGPEECTYLLFNTFRTPAYMLVGNVPGYLDFLHSRGEQDRALAYEEYRCQLQYLQWGEPRRHWVLKSPVHGWGLDVLLRLFPDACAVQTHRDMNKVVPSTLSLFAVSRGLYSDGVDCTKLGGDIRFLSRELLEPMTQARAAHPGRVFDLHYTDLVRDPITAVRSVYDYFRLDLDEGMEERMQRWLAGNPANKHGVHHYDLEQFGLTPADVAQWFAKYHEDYRIAPETRPA